MWIFKTFIISSIMISQSWAMPKSYEVWFISSEQQAKLQSFMNVPKQYMSQKFAQNVQCQPMGEYCFDPQIGLYKMGENQVVKEKLEYEEVTRQEKINSIESASSLDRQLIECDTKSEHWDIFCGKANGKKPAKYTLELWIDTSSSMKQMDDEDGKGTCAREQFVKSIDQKCPRGKKMDLLVFSESIKQSDTIGRTCENYGLNNYKRLLEKLQDTTAQKVIIVTDIFEADVKFIGEIERSGIGKHLGVDKPMTAKDLMKEVKRLTSFCAK